jgi:hypothetical protein
MATIETGSNRLPLLAAEIRKAHADVQEAAKTAAERAIAAGHALIEAKELLKHGEWLPWLREHCALAERTAQLYMKIARSGLESATIADLGLNAAANALHVHFADPWADQPEEAKREWLLYMLFKVTACGWRLEDAEHHAHWAQRNGFATPNIWLGEEGDKYRDLWGRRGLPMGGRCPAEYKALWQKFATEHAGRSLADLDAQLRAIAAAEPPEEVSRPRRRRKARPKSRPHAEATR